MEAALRLASLAQADAGIEPAACERSTEDRPAEKSDAESDWEHLVSTYRIYQKLDVRNRVELVNRIRGARP